MPYTPRPPYNTNRLGAFGALAGLGSILVLLWAIFWLIISFALALVVLAVGIVAAIVVHATRGTYQAITDRRTDTGEEDLAP